MKTLIQFQSFNGILICFCLFVCLFVLQQHNEPKSGATSTFIPFLGGSQQNGFFSVATATTPWLALLTMEIEHDIFEAEVKLWPEIIRQLHASSNKSSMDNVIKVGTFKGNSSNKLHFHHVFFFAKFRLITEFCQTGWLFIVFGKFVGHL